MMWSHTYLNVCEIESVVSYKAITFGRTRHLGGKKAGRRG